MCADNGVVGGRSYPDRTGGYSYRCRELPFGDTSACVMCRQCGTDVYPVDVGMAVDTKGLQRVQSDVRHT